MPREPEDTLDRPGSAARAARERLVAGRYRLESVLGRGGMGIVWAARDQVLPRDVAIKEVLAPLGLEDAERALLRARTLREARSAARVSAEGVVAILDVVEEDGRPWLVMERLPSRTLEDELSERGGIPPREVAEIGASLVAGLAAAHRAGILHRDVKPSNIMFRETPRGRRAVLGDFGIAHLDGDATLTATGQMMGSPAYIAPERARGERATPASDLWSLGVTLWAAVEGWSPFQRVNSLASLTAVITEEPPRAAHAGPLEPLLDGLLRKDPARRIDATTAGRLLREALAAEAPPTASPVVPTAGPVVPPASPVVPTAGPVVPTGPVVSTGPVLPTASPAPPTPASVPASVPVPVLLHEPSTTRPLPRPPTAPERTPSPALATSASIAPLATGGAAAAVAPVPARATDDADVPDAPPWWTPGPIRDDDARSRTRPRRRLLALVASLVAVGLVGFGATLLPGLGGPGDDVAGTQTTTSGTTVDAGASEPGAGAADDAADDAVQDDAAQDGAAGDDAAQDVPAAADDAQGGTTADGAGQGATGGGTDGTGAEAGQGAGSDGSPAGGAVPTGAGAAGAGSAGATAPVVPDGFQWHEDPTGFGVAVPAGWTVEREGPRVYLHDPATAAYLLVDQTDEPAPDPVEDWRRQEPVVADRLAGYARVGEIEAVDFRGWRAADWEFVFGPGQRTHVLNRNLVTAPDQAYALYWSVPSSRWDAMLGVHEQVVASFRPRS
ncbi:serine/threonine-protein kinase [Cellulomonas aerilata]|uniref:serine/threonine-protein kinase n=1 Tax=Cellulomonas aerilata TaxID=515326 RepID=UPI0011BE8AD1|nr:serine/threonine-protein kinase [Cellulomonas aerilata]